MKTNVQKGTCVDIDCLNYFEQRFLFNFSEKLSLFMFISNVSLGVLQLPCERVM